MLEAFQDSWNILEGKVFKMFVLSLSFILWGLLVVITFGIASIYVTPYMNVTYSLVYLDNKQIMIEDNHLDSFRLDLNK